MKFFIVQMTHDLSKSLAATKRGYTRKTAFEKARKLQAKDRRHYYSVQEARTPLEALRHRPSVTYAYGSQRNISARKARVILHHRRVGGHRLTARQFRFFGARASGYPIRNPKRLVRVYGKVLRIEAQKTGEHRCDSECRRFGHKYYHNFRVGPKMFGLPNGDLLITAR